LDRASLNGLTYTVNQGKPKILTTVAEINETVVDTNTICSTLIHVFEESDGRFFSLDSFALSVDKSEAKRSLTFSKTCTGG